MEEQRGTRQQHFMNALSLIVLLASVYLLFRVEDPVQSVNSIIASILDRISGTNDSSVPRKVWRHSGM